MAVFKYQFQGILDIKQKLEDQEKINYSLAAAMLANEQEVLTGLMLRKNMYEKESRSLVEGSLRLREIKLCREAIETIQMKIQDQLLVVRKAERNLEQVRRRLNDIMIERKTYEKLKEKQFDNFLKEIQYEENKSIDELISYSYRQSK